MHKSIILACTVLALNFYGVVQADTMTDDSTNTYTDSKQLNEKLHQKPVANDANSGSDMSTTKDTNQAVKKQRSKKHKAHKQDATMETPTTTGNGTTTGNTGTTP